MSEQQQIRLSVNSAEMRTAYANAFQTNATADEMLISFGINHTTPSQEEGISAEMTLQLNERIIMNYYTAKRLTLSLLQILQEHESRFGVIELDVNNRLIDTPEDAE